MTTIYINDGIEREIIPSRTEQQFLSEFLEKWGYITEAA